MAYTRYARIVSFVCVMAAIAAACPTRAAAEEAGFEALFDGKSLAGWKAGENPDSWKVVDGQIVCHGPRSHLFYVGISRRRC